MLVRLRRACLLNFKFLKAYSSTVDASEAGKFSMEEGQWWDIRGGPLAPIHTLNTLRVPFIREALIGTRPSSMAVSATPLSGYKILDIGCGGGILSEALARLGADVLGIDPTHSAIAMATARAQRDPYLIDKLSYRNCSVEELGVGQGVEFDCVVASEVVEHVPKVKLFVEHLCGHVKPGGVVVFSTINRTLLSMMVAIVAAEYVTGVVPRGTHHWDMFVSPEELEGILKGRGFGNMKKRGMFYNVLSGKWYFISDTSVNYCMYAIKDL